MKKNKKKFFAFFNIIKLKFQRQHKIYKYKLKDQKHKLTEL